MRQTIKEEGCQSLGGFYLFHQLKDSLPPAQITLENKDKG